MTIEYTKPEEIMVSKKEADSLAMNFGKFLAQNKHFLGDVELGFEAYQGHVLIEKKIMGGIANPYVRLIIGGLCRDTKTQQPLNKVQIRYFIDPQYIGREFINETQDTVFTLIGMGVDPQGGRYIEYTGNIRPQMVFWLKEK